MDRGISNGLTAEAVNALIVAKGGTRVSRNTISKHKLRHVTAVLVQRAQVSLADVRKAGARVPSGTRQDMAILVRDRGVERLLDPNDPIDVTIAEALRAQEMIDRRAEKQEEHDIIVSMWFGQLSGATPPQLTEGEYVELHPDEPGWFLHPGKERPSEVHEEGQDEPDEGAWEEEPEE
jgi:hypothetical protein